MRNRWFIPAALIAAALLLMGCATVGSGEKAPGAWIREMSVLVPAGDHEIPVIITFPAGSSTPVPAVVMLHGTGSDKNEAGNGYLMLAPKLAEAGIAAIRFDFPGSGESTASYELYSNTTAIRDAQTVASYVSSLAQIDGNRIGILGWSQGGSDALLAAAEDSRFRSVMTWAGAIRLSHIATPAMRAEAAEKGFALLDFDWRSSLPLSQKWIDDADTMDILSYAARIEVPIASVHGTLDTVVALTDSEKVQAQAKNPVSRLIPVEGADHTFNIFTGDLSAYEILAAETVAWFSETL